MTLLKCLKINKYTSDTIIEIKTYNSNFEIFSYVELECPKHYNYEFVIILHKIFL